MTLGEFFDYLSANPFLVLYYSLAIPIIAGVVTLVAGEDGKESPWKYIYSTLIFLVCIPGVLAFFLNIYLFLFEKQAILDTNLYTQVLPIILMVGTLLIIRSKTAFCDIPGFEKLSGMMLIMSALIVVMWFVDRTHIIAISFIPIHYLLILFVALFFVIKYGAKKILDKKPAAIN